MNKNLIFWIIAVLLGTFIFAITNIRLFKSDSWADILQSTEIIYLFTFSILLHLLISGRFIKKWYFSVPIILLFTLARLFKILHWEGGDQLLFISHILNLVIYTSYYFLKPNKSNVDIFILLFIVTSEALYYINIFNAAHPRTLDDLTIIPKAIAIIICLLHLRNEYIKVSTSS